MCFLHINPSWQMNYIKIYTNIIRKARKRNELIELDYSENHHVIPRSIAKHFSQPSKAENPSNLVKLTAKEHYICHLLLVKITQKRYQNFKAIKHKNVKRILSHYRSMMFAFNMMKNATANKNQSRLKINKKSILFETIKSEHAQLLSESNTIYTKEKVEEMANFYVKHNITDKNKEIFCQHFNWQLSMIHLRTLFSKFNISILAKKRELQSPSFYSLDEFYEFLKIKGFDVDKLQNRSCVSYSLETIFNWYNLYKKSEFNWDKFCQQAKNIVNFIMPTSKQAMCKLFSRYGLTIKMKPKN